MAFDNKRLRLYGKPATKEEIAKEVSKLLLSNKGATEVSRILGFKVPKTIYNYRDLAVKLGYLQLDQDGKPKLPKKETQKTSFREFCETHPFTKEPIIAEWVINLSTRRQGKLVSKNSYIRNFEIVCNSLRVHPTEFLQSLKNSETLLENFINFHYLTGKAKMKYSADPTKVDQANVQYTFSKAVRDFMNFNGLRYPKGTDGVMSQKVPNHAKYGHIRLTKEEIEKLKYILTSKYGVDSDEFRVIMIALESCSRASALLEMTLDYDKHTSPKTGKTTYIMTAYESKTQHIEGGRWVKYIRIPETQESIDLAKSRGASRIYESKKPKRAFEDYLKKVSKELFVELGKIPNIEELEFMLKQGYRKTGNYFFDHPLHVFRHIGAHYWLEKKGYNHSLVAELGGWHTVDELKRSYGKIPPDVVLKLLEDEQL